MFIVPYLRFSVSRPFNGPVICFFRHLTVDSKDSKVIKNNKKNSQSKGAPKKTQQTDGPSKGPVKFEPQIDDGTYKAQQYYQHNEWSFSDYNAQMSKYRLPVPSNKS